MTEQKGMDRKVKWPPHGLSEFQEILKGNALRLAIASGQ